MVMSLTLYIIAHVQTCVQNVGGTDAGALVSSEFAAMMDLIILPALRKLYGNTAEQLQAACQCFAEELGLEDAGIDWCKVTFPAYISFDNASVHEYGRKLLFRPRQSDEKLYKVLCKQYQKDFGEKCDLPTDYDVFAHRRPPPPPPPGPGPDTTIAHNLLDAQRGGRQEPSAYVAPPKKEPPKQSEQDKRNVLLREILQDNLQTFYDSNGYSWENWALWQLSCSDDEQIAMPGMICLLPQQLMPLPPVTPDIHSPVEHLVGSVKWHVHSQVIEHFADSNVDFFSARTYQKWIEDAVEKYGNGERGQRHVRRSVEKQKCICQILRTPVGKTVRVEYVVDDDGADPNGTKQTVHTVQGTGGGWITGNKWS
jgi:hypothetical protein